MQECMLLLQIEWCYHALLQHANVPPLSYVPAVPADPPSSFIPPNSYPLPCSSTSSSHCRLYESDPEECIQQCQSLLDDPNLDTAVRVGDVYGLMIEHYGQGGNYKQVEYTTC